MAFFEDEGRFTPTLTVGDTVVHRLQFSTDEGVGPGSYSPTCGRYSDIGAFSPSRSRRSCMDPPTSANAQVDRGVHGVVRDGVWIGTSRSNEGLSPGPAAYFKSDKPDYRTRSMSPHRGGETCFNHTMGATDRWATTSNTFVLSGDMLLLRGQDEEHTKIGPGAYKTYNDTFIRPSFNTRALTGNSPLARSKSFSGLRCSSPLRLSIKHTPSPCYNNVRKHPQQASADDFESFALGPRTPSPRQYVQQDEDLQATRPTSPYRAPTNRASSPISSMSITPRGAITLERATRSLSPPPRNSRSGGAYNTHSTDAFYAEKHPTHKPQLHLRSSSTDCRTKKETYSKNDPGREVACTARSQRLEALIREINGVTAGSSPRSFVYEGRTLSPPKVAASVEYCTPSKTTLTELHKYYNMGAGLPVEDRFNS